MGIPKLFRFLSERYPLINEKISGPDSAPEFDNLYLDMNGIIHNCSHPSSEDSLFFRLTEEEMMTSIFHYIDKLFHMVQPQKLFFMAIDGVAPRAKLNQQRQRRFKSALEAKERLENARKKGVDVPEEPPFDSNCITPGTEFMFKLSHYIRYFIKKKMQEDAAWRRVQVIFSGHDVPGEGEHKIMDYIRHQKAQPNYDPNIRHCLYGLDADLIMLSLTSHEPHFCLLREDVLTKKSRKPKDPTDQSFHLLHISLLREYLNLEFRDVQTKNGIHNLERIIDDFVLLCFFVGNDFLPTLPHQDIADGALNNMFLWYKELLPMCEDYLTNGSQINLPALELFLRKIGEDERKSYEFIPQGANLSELLGESSMEEIKENKDQSLKKKRLENDLKSIGQSLTLSTSQELEEDVGWRDYYYRDKFQQPISNVEYHSQLRQSYLEGLCWVLNYYHHGCNSWGWFYPYHYAPLAADMKNLDSYVLKFELGSPFHPYEQLLAVLPPASAKLLPQPFRRFMLEKMSPIIDFYPENFTLDLNGKKNGWEAIVVIDFINQNRLLEAVKSIPLDALTHQERFRNEFGHSFIYQFNVLNPNEACSSPFADKRIGDFECKVSELPYEFPDYPEGKHLGFYLHPKALLGKYAPFGFPTLEILNFTTRYKKGAVNVFGSMSSKESLIIELDVSRQPNSVNEIKNLLGKTIYVDWPYFKEAIVEGIENDVGYYEIDKNSRTERESFHQDVNIFKKEVSTTQSKMLSKKAVDSGPIKFLFHVRIFSEMQENRDGSRSKVFSDQLEVFPFQTVVTHLISKDPRHQPTKPLSLEQLFPAGQLILNVGPQCYGYRGIVQKYLGSQSGKDMFLVKLEKGLRPGRFGREVAVRTAESYYSIHQVADSLGIHARILSKITADVFFEPGHHNLGLPIKFSGKKQQVLGYSRSVDSGYANRKWEFSERAINLIKEYKEKFPLIFQLIEKDPDRKNYDVSDLVENNGSGFISVPLTPKTPFTPKTPKTPKEEDEDEIESDESSDEEIALKPGLSPAHAYLNAVKLWLNAKNLSSLARVPFGSEILSTEGIEQIEEASTKWNKANESKLEILPVKLPREYLVRPSPTLASHLTNSQSFTLGDRVVVATSEEKVPFGTFGTVVGLRIEYIQIILDKPSIGGTTLNKCCTDLRGAILRADSLLNLTTMYYGAEEEPPQKGPETSHQRERYENNNQKERYENHNQRERYENNNRGYDNKHENKHDSNYKNLNKPQVYIPKTPKHHDHLAPATATTPLPPSPAIVLIPPSPPLSSVPVSPSIGFVPPSPSIVSVPLTPANSVPVSPSISSGHQSSNQSFSTIPLENNSSASADSNPPLLSPQSFQFSSSFSAPIVSSLLFSQPSTGSFFEPSFTKSAPTQTNVEQDEGFNPNVSPPPASSLPQPTLLLSMFPPQQPVALTQPQQPSVQSPQSGPPTAQPNELNWQQKEMLQKGRSNSRGSIHRKRGDNPTQN